MAHDPNTRLSPSPPGASSLFTLGPAVPSSAEWRREAGLGLLALGLLGAGLLWLFSQREARPPPPPPPPPPAATMSAQCAETRPAETFEVAVAPPTPPLLLGDGSMVELHDATSRLFSEEESSEHVRLRLSGGATFDVVPNQARSFVVSNGQVVVRSLGTAFSMAPEGARTLVAVTRGRVQILWPRGAAILSAGDVAMFPPADEQAFVSRRSLAPAKRSLRVKHARHARSRAKSRAKKAR